MKGKGLEQLPGTAQGLKPQTDQGVSSQEAKARRQAKPDTPIPEGDGSQSARLFSKVRGGQDKGALPGKNGPP